MAFLEQDAKPIVAGWGPEPQLHAPEIGPTLAAILTNRRVQQQQTQEALTAAIKAQQDRNQDAAFAQAMQNTGLTEGQDVSGLSSAQMARMAQLLADRTPDTDRDALLRAQAAHLGAATNKENTIADYIKQYGHTPGARSGVIPSDTPQTYVDDYGREWRQGTGGHWFLIPKNQNKQAMDAQANAAPELDPQTITPDEPVTPPSANPDVTITPTPPPSSAAPPADTSAGHAQDYGKPVSDQDVAALGWARAHPNDPRSAAILQKLGIQ
jgi:hypothetical protein